MQKPDHFFDDSDMNEPFQITVVYHSKQKIPLLSSRNVFDNQFINKAIKGSEPDSVSFDPVENDMLCDRLSGNTNHPYFKKNRDLIFGLYYAEILKKYPRKSLYLMARSEFSEPLLTKYLRLGFTIIGQTTHNEKKHWVLNAKTNLLLSKQRQQVFLFLLLLIRK